MEDIKVTYDFLTSPGQLGEMIRNYDWASTSLGPIAEWPQSLKTTISLMLNTNNPTWLGWGPDNIFFYNDAYIEVLGKEKHKWALGKPTSIVWEEIWHLIKHLSDMVFQEGKSSNIDDMHLFMRRGDFLEEVFYSFSYSPVINEQGKVGGLFCPNFETTSKILNARRNRTLAQLAEKSLINKTIEAALASAAHTLGENKEDIPFAMLYILDQQSNRTEIIKHIGTDDLVEEIFPHFIEHNDNTSPYAALLSEIITTGKGKVIQLNNPELFPRGLADQVVKQAVAIPFSMTGNKAAGIMVCGVNPTRRLDDEYYTFYEMAAGQISAAIQNVNALENERKRAEELAEIDKAKTAFFSNISHEFRTPLTLMLGPLEELLQNDSLDNREKDIIDTTHRNAIRLLRLVNTLLDFSLMESGRLRAKFVPTDISLLTKNLTASFNSITQKAGLEFIVNIQSLTRDVYIDREMWEKIVFNLLSNAFKYTLRGTITISVTQDNNNVVLTVKDTGMGIPKKELANMFTRFHRIQNTTGRSFEGSGIGLSMIKELIHQHGGEITVDSAEGQGSTFTVIIPFGKDHLPEAQIFEESIDNETFLSDAYLKEAETMLNKEDNIEVDAETIGKKQDVVLIVDDNADMRKHLKAIIEKEYRVITAINGKDALEKIQQIRPTLILSDIMMPVMDGVELLKTVKENRETASIPVILLTARAGEESKIAGYETGADDYLVKPFSAKELVARIHSQIKITNTRDHARRQLQNLFMQAPVAICILKGKDFVVEMANDNILEMWGKPAAVMMNRPLLEGLPEAAEQGYGNLLEKVYTTGRIHIDEEAPFYKIENGIARQIYVKFVYQPFYEETGEISGIMVLANDITLQVEARKKVEESETKFRNLIHQAHMPIVILKGRDMVFDFVNDAYLKLHNKKREDLLGIKLTEALPILKSTAIIENLKKVMANGVTQVFSEVPVDMTKNGITETRYFTSVYQPLIENDTITGIISIVNEVTQQYLAKKIQKQNEKDLKTILETMPQMAYRINAEGRPVYHSEKFYKYTGLTKKNANDNGWRSIIHPDMTERIYKIWAHSMKTGEEFDQAFLIKRASDGMYRWHLSRAVALRNNKGEITQWIGTLTDIHEQKVFEEELEAMVNNRTEELNESNLLLEQKNAELEITNKELESFNYIASHDLQEPLRKIQTFISFIKDRDMSPEEAQGYINKIHASAGRMTQLIKDVLIYSRLTSEQQFTKVDLNEILEIVLADYELFINEKDGKVVKDKLPVITAIPLQMEQLFSNLISNSLKYSDKTPVITITYKKNDDDGTITITFSDNGIGFEEKYSEQIFKLFQRLHGKNDYAGTGIGLSICKKIVELHKGSISAESIPGKGAIFNIILPVEHFFTN